MKLKHYQEKVLTTLKDYLSALATARAEFEEISELKPHLAKHFDFPKEAWEKATGRTSYGKFTQGNG